MSPARQSDNVSPNIMSIEAVAFLEKNYNATIEKLGEGGACLKNEYTRIQIA